AGEDGHRPLVVEATSVALLMGLVRAAIGRAPQAGVTGRVVDQLQVRIIAIPAPSSATADLVVLAREGLDTEVGTGRAVLRMGLIGVRRQADVLVGARRVAGPHHGAVLEVVSHDAAARGELVATEADD